MYLISRISGDDFGYKMYWQRQYEKMDVYDAEKCLKRAYNSLIGGELDFNNPKTFDAKLQWLKLYDATPLKTICVDKYLVRNYIREKVGNSIKIVPLIGVWDNFDDIDFDSFPNRFVLKTNHGSGMNVLVKDKKEFDITDARKKFDRWLKINYALQGNFEMQYRDVTPKIIAEEYLDELGGGLLNNYKFLCFGGKVHYCNVVAYTEVVPIHKGYEAFFDADGNEVAVSGRSYEKFPNGFSLPDKYKDLIKVAEKLSDGFSFVRVDLYLIKDDIYFGELTFTPKNGIHPYFGGEEAWEEKLLGDLIKLPEPYILKMPLA